MGALDHAAEEEDGDLFGFALFGAVAAGEVQEGAAGFGDVGEDGAELCELGGAMAVFEGVEVASGGAGAGASAAPGFPARGWGLGIGGWRHGIVIVGRGRERAEGEVAKGDWRGSYCVLR